MVLGVGFWVTGIGSLELTGFGLSLVQPTVSEQTIRSAPNKSAPVFFPHVIDLRDSEIFLSAIFLSAILLAELKQLIRVMVGHLLLLSSATNNASGVPTGRPLILLGLRCVTAAGIVERETRRGCCDTFEAAP